MKDAAPPPLTPPDALAVSPLAGSWLVCVALAALLWALSASSAESSILRVPEDYPTIQSAVDAATSGDEIVLSDGEFNGDGNTNIVLPDVDLTIRSENGPDFTSMVGERETETWSFGFDIRPSVGRTVSVQGIEFRDFYWYGGSALICAGRGAVDVLDCHVRYCVSPYALGSRGGGVLAAEEVTLSLIDCLLEEDEAAYGGAVASTDGATLNMVRCTVRLSWNTAVWIDDWSEAWLEDTVIDSNYEAVKINAGSSATLDRCILVGNGGGAVLVAGSATIRRSTIVRNEIPGRGAGVSTAGRSPVLILDRTILRDNCSFFEEEDDLAVYNGAYAVVTCCALDSSGVYGLERIEFDGEQVWVDPLFCALPERCPADGEYDGYWLQSNSPCTPWRSPCGDQIGVFGVACGGEIGACCIGHDCSVMPETECVAAGGVYQGDDTECELNSCEITPVVLKSWGQIKAKFGAAAEGR